jgi:NADP-dependent 3-hydroxy acid dehydrogenase YdfG
MSVPPVPADVFAGTAVVITGGASGIGRAKLSWLRVPTP